MAVIAYNTRTIASVFIVLGGCSLIIAGTYSSADGIPDMNSVQAFITCAYALFSLACAIHFSNQKVISLLCLCSAFLFFIVAILYWVLVGDKHADVQTHILALRSVSLALVCTAVTSILQHRYSDRGGHWSCVLLFGFGAAAVFAVYAVLQWMEESTSFPFRGVGFGLFSFMMAVYAHNPV